MIQFVGVCKTKPSKEHSIPHDIATDVKKSRGAFISSHTRDGLKRMAWVEVLGKSNAPWRGMFFLRDAAFADMGCNNNIRHAVNSKPETKQNNKNFVGGVISFFFFFCLRYGKRARI